MRLSICNTVSPTRQMRIKKAAISRTEFNYRNIFTGVKFDGHLISRSTHYILAISIICATKQIHGTSKQNLFTVHRVKHNPLHRVSRHDSRSLGSGIVEIRNSRNRHNGNI